MNANMCNKRQKLKTILLKIQKKVNQIVTLMMTESDNDNNEYDE